MVRLGQNFLADPNLVEAIVRDAAPGAGDVVLEVGAGEGVLTRALAPRVRHVHAIELDPGLEPTLSAVAEAGPSVEVVIGDAMRLDLAALDPAPTALIANLPYSVATPVLVRTVVELASIASWTAMVQLEIAERLAAAPGRREYAAPSAILQLACEVRVGRRIGREVFRPRPRVDSALLHMRRTRPPPGPATVAMIRAAFAHRRKTAAGSLELALDPEGKHGLKARASGALERLGIERGARAEAMRPAQLAALAAELGEHEDDPARPGS